MQVKAYVRAHGVPDTWEERDRGYLSLWYNYWASEYIDSHDPIKFAKKTASFIRILLITMYISLNIFITLIFIVVRNKYEGIPTQMRSVAPISKQIYSQAVVVGIVSANIAYTVVFLAVLTSDLPTVWATIKGSQTSHNPPIPTGSKLYRDEKITFIVKYTTLPVTTLIDLFLAVKSSHSAHFRILSKAVNMLGCCCCCCSQGMKSKTLRKTFQTLLWWNVMLFIQIYVGQVALPVFILFIIAPDETVANVAWIALAHIFIAIALVYIARVVCYHCSRKNCGHACAELMVLAVIFVLTVSVGSFYFTILEAGTNYRGVKGVIISLAPSIVLSFIAWFIRKKIISRGKDKISMMEMVTDHRDHDERMERRAFAEEQIKLLQSATKSVGYDLV